MPHFHAYPVDAILLIGPTGSGKSPLGDSISSLGFVGRRSHHLDFGSELRTIASGTVLPAASYTPAELDFIHAVLERGLLLENEHFALAEKIIGLYLVRSGFRSRDVLVLNGIPRHEGQAKDISSLARVCALVVLECSSESVIQRIKDDAGGDRAGRTDDGLVLIDKKLRLFQERTVPLINLYEREGSRVYRIHINERTTAGSAYRQLSSLAAADPPVALVAEPPQG